jgi:hypothetical protein
MLWLEHHSTRKRHFLPAKVVYILERNILNIALYGTENWTLQKVDQIARKI